MEKFHTFEWNKHDKEFTMIILSEEDVLNELPIRGAGYEILVLSKKFENDNSDYLNHVRMLAKVRCGKIIYV
jgi:hypothetical protein